MFLKRYPPWNAALFGIIFVGVIKVKSSKGDGPELRWTQNPIGRALLRDRMEKRQRGEGHVTTKAEMEMMLPQAKKRQGSPTATRS